MIFPDIELEKKLWEKGYRYVVGIDEAGRGPLAGPVSAGAVLINADTQIVDIVRDSKKMTEKQREKAFDLIKASSVGWGIGLVSAREIDSLGITYAVCKAMSLALHDLESRASIIADYLIVDGLNVDLIDEYKMMKIKGGDLLHYSISAASVLAKVARDRVMKEYALGYPEYGFEYHVGYGTKKHLDAIERYGICDIHRRSYKPVAKYVK